MTPEQMKKILDNAPDKADQVYIDCFGCFRYFYKHPNSGWREVDKRTTGWDSDRCCYDMHPPISNMISVDTIRTELAKHEPMDLRSVDIPHGTIVLEK